MLKFNPRASKLTKHRSSAPLGPLPKKLKNAKQAIVIVAKALDGQRYPLPLCEYVGCEGERGSGPEGADDLCLVSFEALGLKMSINNGI